MGQYSEWADIGEEEQALLRRCRKFVFGSPDAPGRGAKDILYFTPCKRWLRICVPAAYEERLEDSETERAFRLDSGAARNLFDQYHTRQPQELEVDSRERDFEVATSSKCSMATPPANYGAREELEEAVRRNPKNIYFAADLANHRPRSAYPCPEDPCDIVGAEEEIERNTLLFVLKKWSGGWPSEVEEELIERNALLEKRKSLAKKWSRTAEEPQPLDSISDDSLGITGLKPEELTPCEADVLRFLLQSASRLTRPKILQDMRTNGIDHGQSTIYNALSKLKRLGLLDNRPGSKPRGYQLTEQGRLLAERLG